MEQDRDVGVERRPGYHGGVVEVAEAVHFLPFPRVAQQTVPVRGERDTIHQSVGRPV